MDIRQLVEDFPAYLANNQLAPPKHIPHLQRWAELYLTAMHDPGLCPDDRLRAFLAELGMRRGLADWQICQAENAVKLMRLFARERGKSSSKTAMMSTPKLAVGISAADKQPSDHSFNHIWRQTWDDEQKLLRLRHYSPETISAYLDWARRFAEYVHFRAPDTLAEPDVKRFLTHLAMERRVSASTQNQAFNALLFLFRDVLMQPLDGLKDTVRAKRGQRLPVVFSREETERLFAAMDGTTKLMAQLTYGAGLRLMECIKIPGCAGAEIPECRESQISKDQAQILKLWRLRSPQTAAAGCGLRKLLQ